MISLRQIVTEEIQKLLEREAKSSVNYLKVASFASKYNFVLLSASNAELVFYYKGKNLHQDFDNFNDVVIKCGWTIYAWGNHYDGLRNFYTRFEKEHPEFGVGTFFAIVEPEYGTKMDDYFGTNRNELLNNDDDDESLDFWDKGFSYSEASHLGVGYERGVFYHVTTREFLRPILSHGLKPKNGGGFTRFRSTSNRLYLSLLPDFEDVEYMCPPEEESPDDSVILRVDLRSVMDNFEFYVDSAYSNAVYTYSNIPPKFIEVISDEEIKKLHSQYYFEYAIREGLKDIIKKNFHDCNEEEKKRNMKKHSYEISSFMMPKLMKSYFKFYNVSEEYLPYVATTAKKLISQYYNS